jgi:integrase
MAQTINRLTARGVQTLTKPGRHSDGGGLYLVVETSGAKRWTFIYRSRQQRVMRGGRLVGVEREMGLGGLSAVSLAQARELASQARTLLAAGGDPLSDRRYRDRAQRIEAASRSKTFGDVADELIASRSPGWRNAKHRAQWGMTLETYAAPLREKAPAEITTEDVVAVLSPIWMAKPETAARTRGRIEAVIDAARVRGLIEPGAANPARWRGHLDHLLPTHSRRLKRHHAALDWREMPAFMKELAQREGTSARALEFCILTAARIGEVLGLRWQEIDLASAVWECPAERMKAGRPHRVPLSPAAVAVLARMTRGEAEALVFPGAKPGKPLSNMVMVALFKRMKREGITTHGFRSTFRDWAGEATHYPREICEAALAHAVGNAVEQAYRRGDALEKRRSMMAAWAMYCGGSSHPHHVIRLSDRSGRRHAQRSNDGGAAK